ncbi:sodium/potassium/calcium exchanger Nckx30C-like isoform X3 [Varroa jacobsoni]|uniref:Sodium/calcium exchanger membrane region domain-containing protein n=1 Tax=Varroa destructor TaxID=109461 RepID=A0A7M7KVZ4_VARDE|nr:sodium/potassium/calcium exchanger Nckx30C-like isoform X3 [Varroa destructor]XP_022694631.1 sodium/potassium/calcium exchanger Nckx30C-like isoform X3 [Varroa jacobsoni]
MGLVTLEATARGGIRCRPRKRLRSPVIYLLSTFLVGSLYSLFHGSITGGTDGSNNAASMIFRFTSHDCALHDGGFHSRNLLQHAATAATTPAPNKTNAAEHPSGSAQFPADLFSVTERRQGAVILHITGLVYMFVALAIVCDEFFIPALDVITEKLAISEDVAGATFMAAGGSAPELFTSVIGVFISFDDVGIGTIVGSAVFNILFVISMCAIFSKSVLQLTWWPLFRDVSFYSIILIILIVFFRDNVIHWWEALILLSCYAAYVTFMKYNANVEKFVKKFTNRNKVTRVGSTDQLMPQNARRRRMSVPTIHGGGGKFRHGLLQLLIHSIDPLHEHEGKVDEKASQLHTIASLGVLLDATGPGSSGSPTPTPLNGSAGGAGSGAGTRLGSSAYKDSTRRTTLDNNIDFQVGPGAGEEKAMPPVEESLKTSSSLNEAAHPDSGYNSAAQQAAQRIREETIEEAMEEAAKPLSIAWPDTWRERLNYVALAPIIFPLWLTLPDVRREEKRKYVAGLFLGSIIWIAVFSYLMVWWATVVGDTFGIPSEVMGLTFLAAGTSIPDLITSVLVARKGFGDMAVSSSVGSNIFDVAVGLPLPWFLSCLVFGPVIVSSSGMACSIFILFMMLVFVIVTIAMFNWKMNFGLAMVMFLLYFIFIACSLLLEYEVVRCQDLVAAVTGNKAAAK